VAENIFTAESAVKTRPIVTLALFSYNQERFIRDAVRGAFEQTYQPLEIILSDDCSVDQTFEIMEEMAKNYRGPHTVLVRKTAVNRGTLQHVAEVAQQAKGKLLVLAAGDDVSKPERVHLLEQAWEISGAWGLCSGFDRMADDGEIIERNVRPHVLDNHGFRRFFHPDEGPVDVVHGCSSAYDRRVFDYLELDPSDYILAEDGAIRVLLNLLGKKIVHLTESLVCYRETADSLTNNIRKRPLSIKQVERDERRIREFAQAQANRCGLFIRMDRKSFPYVRKIFLDGVNDELTRQKAIIEWFEMSLFERTSMALRGTVDGRWAVPRIFGKRFFYYLKWLSTRI
jgi:glycosyltransferase involved in cell wall biosynthesis